MKADTASQQKIADERHGLGIFNGTTEHTPGPWTADTTTLSGVVEIRDSEKRMLTTVYAPEYTHHPVTAGEAEANARLIAAAPELLDALTDAVANCGCSLDQRESGHHVDCFAPRALEVIRKTRGEL